MSKTHIRVLNSYVKHIYDNYNYNSQFIAINSNTKYCVNKW